MVKTLFFAAVVSLSVVLAQTPPDVTLIPSACSTQCASTIEVGTLCAAQYPPSGGLTTNLAGCFCNSVPASSEIDACTACLGDNDSAALQQAVASAAQACPAAEQQCFFACSFETCASTDVACQCSQEYLSNIFNCASCNSRNGNTAATQIADFESLKESCKNQNYSGAMGDFATQPLPSPTGQDAYVAPVLTGTGGGEAATGSFSGAGPAASDAAPASASSDEAASASAPTTMASASSASAAASGVRAAAASGLSSVRSNASSASSRGASAVSGAVSAAASAAPSGAASTLQAPAALAALAGLVAALF